jgi:hypothetical protein
MRTVILHVLKLNGVLLMQLKLNILLPFILLEANFNHLELDNSMNVLISNTILINYSAELLNHCQNLINEVIEFMIF